MGMGMKREFAELEDLAKDEQSFEGDQFGMSLDVSGELEEQGADENVKPYTYRKTTTALCEENGNVQASKAGRRRQRGLLLAEVPVDSPECNIMEQQTDRVGIDLN